MFDRKKNTMKAVYMIECFNTYWIKAYLLISEYEDTVCYELVQCEIDIFAVENISSD